MTKPAYFAIGVAALALPIVLASTPVQPRYVYRAECFDVQKTTRTTLEAPVKDEHPDMNAATLHHLNVEYKPACGQLEIR
jgi:hypothetical protein